LGFKAPLKVKKNQWLQQNHFYVQFALFFLGLNARILFINSDRVTLALFLIFTILSAMMTVFLYGGRSWCHYVCPFGMVQTVFTGPRGLLGSHAHTTAPKTLTQSMCRIVNLETGHEKSACVGCKTACMDIDSEKSYWQQLVQPGRRLVQYGYLGLVVGYFAYYWLYSGNVAYYFSGAWTHEPSQLATLFKPGFYLFHTAIPIPKLIAAPMTLGAFTALSCALCTRFERFYRGYLNETQPSLPKEQALHRVFSLCTFVAFNLFFVYGGRPEINRLPLPLQFTFQGGVVLVSALWLYKTWERNSAQYTRESLMDKLRRQLKKLPLKVTGLLDGRSWDDLTSDEVYVLAKTLPGATHQERLRIYTGVLKDAIAAGQAQSLSSLAVLQQMRQQLDISDDEHLQALAEAGGDRLYPYGRSPSQQPRPITGLPHGAIALPCGGMHPIE
ncbi:MAG: 4Fe-4S binding protein, partial [Merismopedia sp. SIO2A8]|nr:4Fe-4S binding protein [Merismopedia sp. SIO2A8]